MNEFEFNCPHCNQVLEAPPEMMGNTAECPGCGKSFSIPAIANPGQPPSTPAPVPPPPPDFNKTRQDGNKQKKIKLIALAVFCLVIIVILTVWLTSPSQSKKAEKSQDTHVTAHETEKHAQAKVTQKNKSVPKKLEKPRKPITKNVVAAKAKVSFRTVSPDEAYAIITEGDFTPYSSSFYSRMTGLEKEVKTSGKPVTINVPWHIVTGTYYKKIEARFGKAQKITQEALPGYSSARDDGPLLGNYYWYGRLAFGVLDHSKGKQICAIKYVPENKPVKKISTPPSPEMNVKGKKVDHKTEKLSNLKSSRTSPLFGKWSKPINGLTGKLIASHSAITESEHLKLSVELKNLSTTTLYIEPGNTFSFMMKIFNKQGKIVHPISGTFTFVTDFKEALIPAQRSLTFPVSGNLFPPISYAEIDAGLHAWDLKPGIYTLHFKYKPTARHIRWSCILVMPPITIKIIPKQ